MHRVLLSILAAFLFSALPPHALAAQGLGAATSEVRGHVADETGAPVANARIVVRVPSVEAAVAVAFTNARGEFTLPVAPGQYRLLVSADGFATASQGVTVAAADRTVDVVLHVAGLSETVNVEGGAADRVTNLSSATRTPTPLSDVPQAVSVVTSAMIAEQRMSSMADVVRFMPGVGMAQGEGNRDTPVFRGNSSTGDFFVDGVRDDVQYFRDVYNLERVEALKGPNAMIFGRGGAGGVINRVTRQADWRDTRELAAQFGSRENRRVTGDYGSAVNDTVAARITGLYERSDSYRNGVGVERYGVQPSVAVRLGASTVARASYEHFRDDRTADRGVPSFAGRPVVTDPETFFGDPRNSSSEATVNLFAAVVESDLTDRLRLRNRTGYGLYDKFYQNVFPGAVNAAGTLVSLSAYNNATDRTNLFNQTDLIARARTGGFNHTLMAGAEFGRQVTDNLRNTGYFTAFGPSVTTIQAPVEAPTVSVALAFRPGATDADNHGVATVAAAYVQDQIELTSNLQAVAGLRFDAFNLDFTNHRTGQALSSSDRLLSPRLGLIYKPVLPVSVYGSYSLTYMPRGGDQLSSLTLSNQALEPEQFRNYEVGVKWEAAPALSVTGAVYRLERGNVAVPDPADPTRSILVDAQRTSGVELEASGSLTPAWTVIAGYAYQDGEITRAISATAPAGAVLPMVPDHSVSFWSRYAFMPRWSAAVGVIHRTEVFTSTDNSVVLPGFTRVDAGLFFDVSSRIRAQVNVENLLDDRYFATAHSNNNITPGSPRAVRMSVTVR